MSGRVMRHVVARGRVQGVFFRAFVEREAVKRGVEGWVRNRRDYSVEAVFTGASDAVEAMIEIARRGPSAARVDTLEQREASAAEFHLRRPGELFSVLPTQ